MSLVVPAERKLDYLRFTLGKLSSPDEVFPLLKINLKARDFGIYRYRNSAASDCGSVIVLWNGPVKGMGVHVQLSGEGCRMIEQTEGFPGWQEWIGGWREREASFARVDVALDDLAGGISFDTVKSQVWNGVAAMRCRTRRFIETTSRKGVYHTLYVGSRASETMMRCYDKGMQLGQGRSWLRFEFEYKKKRAEAIAKLFAEKGWDASVGCARAFIEFKDETHVTTDRTRQRPADWWVQLINASKHRLETTKEVHSTLIESWAWLRRQVAPTLGVMMEHQQGDLSWLLYLAEEGEKRFSEKHRRMLQDPSGRPDNEVS